MKDKSLVIEGLQIVDRLNNGLLMGLAMGQISLYYAQLSDHEAAEKLIIEAMEVVKKLDKMSNKKAMALCAIAEDYAEFVGKEKASALLAKAIKPLVSSWVLQDDSAGERYCKENPLDPDCIDRNSETDSQSLSGGQPARIQRGWLDKYIEIFVKLENNEEAYALISEAIKVIRMNKLVGKSPLSPFTLRRIIKVVARFEDDEEAKSLLTKIVESLKITYVTDGSVFVALAESYDKLGDKEKARSLLLKATKAIRQVDYNSDKISALCLIAESYDKIGDKEVASALLLNAWKAISSKTYFSYKQEHQRLILESMVKLKDKDLVSALLLELMKIENRLSEVVELIPKLGDKEKAMVLLSEVERARVRTDKNDDLLIRIVESYAKIGESMRDDTFLLKALKASEHFSDNNMGKSEAMSVIAKAYARFGESVNDSRFLLEAMKMVNQIRYYKPRADALSVIIKSAAKLAGSTNDVLFQDHAFKFIEEQGTDEDRDAILKSILSSKIAIADVGRLRSLALHFTSEAGKAKALARILMAVSQPELIGKEKEAKDDDER